MSEALDEDFDAGTIFGVLVPTGTPKPITTRLNSEIARIMETADMMKRIASMGADPLYLGPAEYAARLNAIHKRMGALVRETGMRAE